jgi:hypothetical protein
VCCHSDWGIGGLLADGLLVAFPTLTACNWLFACLPLPRFSRPLLADSKTRHVHKAGVPYLLSWVLEAQLWWVLVVLGVGVASMGRAQEQEQQWQQQAAW